MREGAHLSLGPSKRILVNERGHIRVNFIQERCILEE